MNRFAALALAVLLILASACVTDTASGFRITGKRLNEGFKRWELTAPPKTRAEIKRLRQDPTALVHLLEGKISDRRSRGTLSRVVPKHSLSKHCPTHPPSEGLDRRRNWDVVYDPDLHRQRDKELQLPSTIEAFLEHEIMGHIVPALERPELIDEQMQGSDHARAMIEDYAIRRENAYRKTVGLPLVPWTARDTLGD